MSDAYKEKVQKILIAAAAAPSGDNSQPWRFVVHQNSLEFHYLPEKDNNILNYEESGTLIALGAAIQNAELEALAQGYTPRTTLCEGGTRVATIELEEGGRFGPTARLLRDAIPNRHSNRKAYKQSPLSETGRSAIFDSSSGSDTSRLILIDSRESMSTVARALTTMEEVALGNHALHKLFFGDILWSEEENRAGKQGLYIKTLELPPPAQALFRLLRHWRFARLLAWFGFPRVVAWTNARQNASASAFGVITATQSDRITYLEVGKMLERIWLRATAEGLSLQIVTGLTFLARSINSPRVTDLFTHSEHERVRCAYETVKMNVEGGHEPILVFRIGTSDSPSDVSYRHELDITFN